MDETAQAKCGSEQVTKIIQQEDFNWLQKFEALESEILEFSANAEPRSALFTVPVVVHVLHGAGESYGTGGNISYDQIKWQLQALNAAFAKRYSAYNGQTHGLSAVDAQIGFCLATITTPSNLSWATDPSSQTECGVMRYAVSPNVLEHDITSEQGLLLGVTHPIGSEFPFTQYLNIWLVSEICEAGVSGSTCNNAPSGPGIVGYATPPGSSIGGLEGIVYRYDAFGDNSVAGNNQALLTVPSLQQGKILAHEVGHYLNLLHTHDPSPLTLATACVGMNTTNCTTEGDRCCDTPPTRTLNFACTASLVNSCNESPDVPDQTENYMSYSDDDCMNTFTTCQSVRMAAVLGGPRSHLVSGANLTATGTTPLANGDCPCAGIIANIDFSPPNPCPAISVCFSTAGGTTATTWAWNFGDLGSGSANTSNLQSPCHTFGAAGTYTVTLTVTDSNGRTYTTTKNVRVAIPSARITGPTPAPTVCKDSQQCVTIEFIDGEGPWMALLTDGSNNYVVQSHQSTICWPVTVRLSNPNFSLVSMGDVNACVGTVSGSASFSVIDCCPELYQNGDFQAGGGCYIAPSTTQQSIPSSVSPPCSWFNPNYYGVYNISAGGYGSIYTGWPNGSNYLPPTGNVMMVDGTNSAVNSLPTPVHTDILTQPLMLSNGATYMTSFWVTQCQSLNLQIKIGGNTFIGSAVTAPLSATTWNWVPINIMWNWTGANGSFAHSICQVTNFGGQGLDYAIDNVSVRRIDNCSVAPCPTGMNTPFLLTPFDQRCGEQGTGFHHSIDVIGNPRNPAGYVSVGERMLPNNRKGLHVVKWDRFGKVVQERLFSTNSPSENIIATSIDVDANCNALVAGSISGGPTPAIFAVSLKPDLSLDTIRRRLSGDMTNGPSVQADWYPDGSAVVSGMSRDANGNPTRGRLARISAAGATIWSKSYQDWSAGPGDEFRIEDLEVAPDGQLWVCGGYRHAIQGEALLMQVNSATGIPVGPVAALYPTVPTGGLDTSVFTAIKMDPTPGSNLGDLLLAGYRSTFSFPNSILTARAARINRAIGAPADWDREYNFSLVPGPSAIGFRRPLFPSAPTTLLIAGMDMSGHRARTLDVTEANGAVINAQTHGNSAPPFTTFRDITPGSDRTMIGHIETTAGLGPQVYFSQHGCPVSSTPTSFDTTQPPLLIEVQEQNESISGLTLVEVPVMTSCQTVCRHSILSGDMNCDGGFDIDDVQGFVSGLLDPEGYVNNLPYCDLINADMNTDGLVDGNDIHSFVDQLLNP